MRYSNLIIISLFCLIYSQTSAQEFDSTRYIEPYYDLNLTPAERDSLRGSLQAMSARIRQLHAFPLSNDVAPAMLFDPLAIVGYASEGQ